MKIAVLTVAFNEERFIEANIRQFKPFKLHHCVLVSSVPWRGDFKPDATWLLALTEEANVHVGVWANQAEQFNTGLELLKDFDWVIIADADEFYERKTILMLMNKMRETNAEAITTPIMEVYWKTLDYRIVPVQSDGPIIAVRPHVRFIDKRRAECKKESCNLTLHHFSYVRDDEEMRKKIGVFEHSHEFDTEKWYNEVWATWDTSKTNLHPVVPSQFQRAVYDPAPQEIRELFDV